MHKPRRQTWPQLYPVSVSFKHLHWWIISYFPQDEMLHVVHHRVTCSIIMLLYFYLNKDCFQSFFNLNIEVGNNSTYQELLAYHFVLVAAIATELRRRWHFDSLSMISASPAGAITRNSFNPYLKTNNNFRWSLRTLTKGSTLISTYYHAKSLIRVCSELCSSRTWWPVAPCFCYWETGKTDYTWGTLDFRGSEHRAQSKALTLSLLLILSKSARFGGSRS